MSEENWDAVKEALSRHGVYEQDLIWFRDGLFNGNPMGGHWSLGPIPLYVSLLAGENPSNSAKARKIVDMVNIELQKRKSLKSDELAQNDTEIIDRLLRSL